MYQLLHSPFLQALGYAIVNSLWQFAFLWLLYFLVNTLFKLSSHQKYTTGLVLELAGFTWFIVTLVFYHKQSALLSQTTIPHQLVYLPNPLADSGASLKQQFFLLVLQLEQFFPYLSVAYLALLSILSFRWVYAYKCTQQVRNSGIIEIDEQWKIFVEKLALHLKVKRRVQIYLSELVQTPLTVGFFKPLILIPLATINYLNTQQMEAVILHELAHIRRYDYLFNLVLVLIEAILFFNPFMQLIHQQIRRERENCCDDWVLKYEYCADTYARALLQIASNQHCSPLLALQATDNKHLLINRIKRIIEKKERTFFNQKHQLLALLVLTIVFSSLSFLSPAKRMASATIAKPGSKIVFEPMAAKVRNPLFNPVFFLANTPKTVVDLSKKTVDIKKGNLQLSTNRLADPVVPPQPSSSAAPEAFSNDNIVTIPTKPAIPVIYDNSPITVANEYNTFFEDDLNEPENRLLRKHREVRFAVDAAPISNRSEGQAERMQAESIRKKDVSELLSKMKPQIRRAFEQVKSLKNNQELVRLHHLVAAGIQFIEKEKQVEAAENELLLRIDELEVLERQLLRKIDSINFRRAFLAYSNNDLTFNIQLPTVVYTYSLKENDHPYSFQYTTKPRVRVANSPASGDLQKKCKVKKEKVVVISDDETVEENQDPEQAPRFHQPPPAKARPVYIIRI